MENLETNQITSLSAQGRYSLYLILTKSMEDGTITPFEADRPRKLNVEKGTFDPPLKGGDSFKYPLDVNASDYQNQLMEPNR